MRRTPWPRLVLVAGLVAVGTYAVLDVLERRGATITAPSPLTTLVALATAVVVAAMGWNVRQYTRGRRPRLDPLVAARTLALATASAYTGALLVGWDLGHVLVTLGELDVPERRAVAVAAAVALVGSVVLTVVGLVVEHWCEVPPPEDDQGVSAGSAA